MARKANPALIGGFVLAAIALAVAALVILGGGKLFRSTQSWVAYFDESIKGLSVGAPVTFRGVRVGTVTDIKVVVDPKLLQIRTPVIFQLEADRITAIGAWTGFDKDRSRSEALIHRGLRAQLEIQSFVTGQLAVNLDFRPDSPINLVGGAQPYPEFPTVPSAMEALGRGLEDLNTAEMAKNAQAVLRGLDRFVNGPELKEVVTAAGGALKGVDRLVASTDARLATLTSSLQTTLARTDASLDAIKAVIARVDGQTVSALNDTLRDAQQVLRSVDGQTVPAVNEAFKDAGKLVRRLDGETVPAVNQVLADLRPLVAELQQTAVVARGALERAESALATVDGALEERSPLRYEVRATLREVSAAARAFRVLSTYLERNPDSVIFGKSVSGTP